MNGLALGDEELELATIKQQIPELVLKFESLYAGSSIKKDENDETGRSTSLYTD